MNALIPVCAIRATSCHVVECLTGVLVWRKCAGKPVMIEKLSLSEMNVWRRGNLRLVFTHATLCTSP